MIPTTHLHAPFADFYVNNNDVNEKIKSSYPALTLSVDSFDLWSCLVRKDKHGTKTKNGQFQINTCKNDLGVKYKYDFQMF